MAAARNYRISVTQGMSGHFAVMLADYEDIDWNPDIVTTGIGRYKTRDEAVKEGKSWYERNPRTRTGGAASSHRVGCFLLRPTPLLSREPAQTSGNS